MLEETNLRMKDALEEHNQQNLHIADTHRRGKLETQIKQACSMRHAASISRDLQVEQGDRGGARGRT
eukprot:768783-Hanusia_phi.AAC.9